MKNLTLNELQNVSGAASLQINEIGNDLFITAFSPIMPNGMYQITFNQLNFNTQGCWKSGTIVHQGDIHNGYKITFQNNASGSITYRFTPVS